MLCENCQERPASVILMQESQNGPIERNLCEKCAFNLQTFSNNPNQEPMSIQQFLSQWLSGSESLQQQTREVKPMPECPECGLTFHRFWISVSLDAQHVMRLSVNDCHVCSGNCITATQLIKGKSQHRSMKR